MLSSFVHHLDQPESLGVIAWLLHCSSLAVCAKDMAAARPHLIVAMNAQAWGLKKMGKYACMMDGVDLSLSMRTKFTSVGAPNTSLDEQTFD